MALVEGLRLAGALALALAVVCLGAVVSLAPDQGGTVSASQLRNWSPVYRQQRDEQRAGAPEEAQSGYTILHTKDSQYHRIAVVEDDDTRYLRFDSSFQSGMLNAIAASDGTRADVITKLFEQKINDGYLGTFSINKNGDPAGAEGAVVGFTIYKATDKLETVTTISPKPEVVEAARGN